ncbi:hypothetical protein MKK75_21880 [Methylobacterium sp. J-030]|uniref:hypothetical protein n=1 Tax=Methylobacterium sp. J-030 TaxID=2836627 RepID=UPI001FB8A35C|nr:hypothetical protein [Methylobacterium sp. J-030]MCJ2071413.1 hypothetical protein [Methylobacterium sp. J-030]
MTAALTTMRAGDGAPLAHLQIAERAGLAARYAEAASSLADAGDTAAMVHALGCAGRAILAAIEAARTLRPTDGGGR